MEKTTAGILIPDHPVDHVAMNCIRLCEIEELTIDQVMDVTMVMRDLANTTLCRAPLVQPTYKKKAKTSGVNPPSGSQDE